MSEMPNAEMDAYDDEWCCRRCYALALEESPLLPGEPAPVIRFREDFKTRPTSPAEPYRDDVLSEQLGIPVIVDERVPKDGIYVFSRDDDNTVTPPGAPS